MRDRTSAAPLGTSRGASGAPRLHPSRAAFAVASCQYPAGMLDDVPAQASWHRLARRLDSSGGVTKPDFLLLVGDQIYSDATAGLFDPTTQFGRHVRPYEKLFRMPPLRDVLRRRASYMLLDDHEISDNWEPPTWTTSIDRDMVHGRTGYFRFQRRHGPALQDAQRDSPVPCWYEFEEQGFPFFMADTRTERTARTASGIRDARIMSEAQFGALTDWLSSKPANRPKFVVTPSILLPRHRWAIAHGADESALRSDGWDGYPSSHRRVLAYIADNQIRNVVFVSGDEHLPCVARATVYSAAGRPVRIYSVHSSPLYAPFPFANARMADFPPRESFRFTQGTFPGTRYRCSVIAMFPPPRADYAMLGLRQNAPGGWLLDVEFDLESGPVTMGPFALTR